MPHAAAEQAPESEVVVRVHRAIPLGPLRTGRTDTPRSSDQSADRGIPIAAPRLGVGSHPATVATHCPVLPVSDGISMCYGRLRNRPD